MADRGQGWVARTAWVLATVIFAVGVGLWVSFWLPWWAGAAIGIPIACVFLGYAIDDISGRLNPTPAGALEISQWWSFAGSIRDGLVAPTLDPSQPDTMLPYAVALNQARQWINDINAVPPLVSPRRAQGTDPTGPPWRLPQFHRRRLLGSGRRPKNQDLLS